jgi:dihydroorotase
MKISGRPVGTFVRGKKVMWENALQDQAQGETVKFLEVLSN